MPFYNLVSEDYKMVLSIQPKCGCSTIKGWVQEQIGAARLESRCISDAALLEPRFDAYEKILIVRNLYDRLISYYSLFVINDTYKDRWIHADENKQLSLASKTFRDFIYILKDLEPQNYQHHLVPQTFNIALKNYDTIFNIKQWDNFLSKRNYPASKLKNRIQRSDYQKSIVDMLPAEFNRMKIPAAQNFQDKELNEIAHKFIYPKDAALLASYFM